MSVVALTLGSGLVLATTSRPRVGPEAAPSPASVQAGDGSGSSAVSHAGPGRPTATAPSTVQEGARQDKGRSTSSVPSRSVPVLDIRSGDLPIEVAVRPGCSRRGGALAAHVTVPKGAHLSLLVVYADGSSDNQLYAGPADAEGRFVYTFVVPPKAPYGPGQVWVAATQGQGRSGTAGAHFTVVDRSC